MKTARENPLKKRKIEGVVTRKGGTRELPPLPFRRASLVLRQAQDLEQAKRVETAQGPEPVEGDVAASRPEFTASPARTEGDVGCCVEAASFLHIRQADGCGWRGLQVVNGAPIAGRNQAGGFPPRLR